MTKSDLVEAVNQKLEQVPKKDVEAIVDTIFDIMASALCRDERIEIRGWGSFVTKVREARKGRNPKTGELVTVPRKRVPLFTAGKTLKERVNSEVNGGAGGQ